MNSVRQGRTIGSKVARANRAPRVNQENFFEADVFQRKIQNVENVGNTHSQTRRMLEYVERVEHVDKMKK